jgi:hypothetical protein
LKDPDDFVYWCDCEIVDGSVTDEEYHRLMVPWIDYQNESDEPVTLRKYVRIEKHSGGKWYTGMEGSCYELVEEVGLTYKIKGPGMYRFVAKEHASVHDGVPTGGIIGTTIHRIDEDKEEVTIELYPEDHHPNAEVDPNSYDFVNPNHYKSFSVEAIDMMVAIYGKEAVAIHCECCALKYKLRAGDKPDQPVDRDLDKASWYLNKAKELRDGKTV